MGLLSFFLSAAATFGKLLGWMSSADRQSRERVATYFDQIAACLREVAERIECGDPPRDTCRRLAVYADQLQYILNPDRSPWKKMNTSAEEIYRQLVAEIDHASMMWNPSLGQRMMMMMVEADAKELPSSGAHVDSLTDEIEKQFTDQASFNEAVQKIWDASGDFKALADSLRAR